ncbi:fibronectin-like [Esox lucius]|uniref:fibronectin-like n=1 Tax=Esox lucius TaxID=8010 RepID=UPI0014773A20|nr:fibronectin-like [Esox lucius]
MFICSLCSATKHGGHDTYHDQMKKSEIQSFERNKNQILTSDYEVGPPENIQAQLLTSDSVSLSWSSPQRAEGPQKFRVTWECGREKISSRVKGGHLEITSLKPGEKYLFTVATEGDDGQLSRCISTSLTTVVPPRDLKVDNVESTSFSLHWTKGKGMETVPQRFLISYSSPGTDPHAVNTEGCYWTFSNLQPGTQYTVDVVTVLTNGEESEPVSITICTVDIL